MRLVNKHGEAVYYNCVNKGDGKFRFVVKAASGQLLSRRDKGKAKSRSFATEPAALRFLDRNGYTEV